MGEGRINYSVVPDYEELFLEEFSTFIKEAKEMVRSYSVG